MVSFARKAMEASAAGWMATETRERELRRPAMVSDKMVVDACQAAYGPHWSFIDAEAMRRALEAVAPAIRAAAREGAAKQADAFAETNEQARPFTSYVEGRAHAGRGIAAAIRALVEEANND